jgi:hypothetical protein
VNVVELEWSPPERDGEARERAARRLERGVYPDAVTSYADVQSFVAG